MTTNPILQKFLEGQLPPPMAQALVSGAMPLPPLDLLEALAHAIFSDTPYMEKAVQTLAEMPESQIQGAILGPVDPPDSLALVAMFRREPVLLETVLLHQSLTAMWMERIVPHLPGSALDIPLNNQVFWIERPKILDLIETHPECEYNLKRRVNEFRRDVLHQITDEVAKDRIEVIDLVQAGRLDRAWAELPLPEYDPLVDEAQEGAPPAPIDEAARELLKEARPEQELEEKFLPVAARLMRLTPNQKAILAMKGGKEERVYLIREANRIIQLNVVRNPRITEPEITYISQMRSVNEEVLRAIAASREWMRKYGVVKSLVQNPKTPLAISLNQLKRLNDLDLRSMAHDRNIAEVLRREAGRALTQRIAKS